MSSFWNFFSDKKENESPSDEEQTPGQNAPTPAADHAGPAGAGAPTPKSPEVQQMKAPVPEPPKPMPSPQKANPRYGIDDAIKLMRTLPVDDNVDLVVRVIKRTLESLAVRVPDIVEDAAKRQEALRTKVSEHKSAIIQLEREIDARRFEIARLEEDLAETTQVRERLQLAEATAMSVTPSPTKASNAPSGLKPPNPPTIDPTKKAEHGGAQRSAPPLPASFRPKPTTPEAVAFVGGAIPAGTPPTGSAALLGTPKKPEPAFPPVKDKDKDKDKDKEGSSSSSEDDDEQPVESRDMVEKD